jgi:hypothetical protein
MGQELREAQPIVDSFKEPYKRVRKFFGYDKDEPARKPTSKVDDRVVAANESYRKRAEEDKKAAAAPKKTTRKRAGGKR